MSIPLESNLSMFKKVIQKKKKKKNSNVHLIALVCMQYAESVVCSYYIANTKTLTYCPRSSAIDCIAWVFVAPFLMRLHFCEVCAIIITKLAFILFPFGLNVRLYLTKNQLR